MQNSSAELENSELSKSTILMMAVACGFAVANIYYNQPMLGEFARSFTVSDAVVGAVPTATQIGYALGLLFLVPLGDRYERRTLILVLSAALAVSLMAAALAPSFVVLVAASLLIGLFGTVAQQIIPMAAHLAPPSERGRIVGSVMSGLLIGILGARTVSGLVAEYWGWRAMFWIATAVMVLIVALVRSTFPRVFPTAGHSYWQILKSLPPLLRDEPTLREAAMTGGLLFASFSLFWSTLTLYLESPAFSLGSAAAGFFGLVGIVGALAAPIAGRLSDKDSPRRVVGFGIVCVIISFLIFIAAGNYIAGLIIGVILLDLGVQAGQIANQSRIYALRPNAHSRVNAVYMFIYFVGAASGSLLGSLAWSYRGWTAVGIAGALIVMIALIIHLRYQFLDSKKLVEQKN